MTTDAVIARQVQPQLASLPHIKNIIAVASGKGGVGKSSVAIGLALALAREGFKTGLLDADVHGPSIPTLLDLVGQKAGVSEDKRIQPLEGPAGLKVMSIGFLVEPEAALTWRGPMQSGAMMQMLNDADWGELDYLIMDLPPGTGDIQLSLAQKIPVAGSVIVSTPHDLALADVQRAVAMFQKLDIAILGVVENMSHYQCEACGHEAKLFGDSFGGYLAQANLSLLASLPLLNDVNQAYARMDALAAAVQRALEKRPRAMQPIPKVVVKT